MVFQRIWLLDSLPLAQNSNVGVHRDIVRKMGWSLAFSIPWSILENLFIYFYI